MLTEASCRTNMTISLQERVDTLSLVKFGTHAGRLDVQKKMLILAGLFSECLMDCEDPFHELRLIWAQFSKRFDLNESDLNSTPCVSVEDTDKTLELGRSLARLYLDDQDDTTRLLSDAVLNIVDHDVKMNAYTDKARSEIISFFFAATHLSLALEVIAHLFCDRVIDLKISQDNWSVSDALMAMSGLAGRYYAFALIDEEERLFAANGDVLASTTYDSSHLSKKSLSMLNLISAEASRMGVVDGSNLLKGIAANDIEYRAYPHLVYSLEPSFAILASKYELVDYAVKSLSVAKATGRMIAVACSGQDAEMEHNVARPLAVASFIGNFEHFSPV